MRGKEFPQKKVLSLVLCVAVMLSVMVMGAGAAFSDQDKIENTEAVDACSALNIIGGYPDGSYKPEGNIKRSEITKMICVALNGGEDYELLFTVPLSMQEQIMRLGLVDVIGHITPASTGCYLVTPDGQDIKLKAQGFPEE